MAAARLTPAATATVPNGFHGPPARWRALEAPLLALDARLERFAAEHGLTVERNARGWPDRRLLWEAGGVHRALQIYPDDPDAPTPTYRVGLVAWQDRPGRGRTGRGRAARERVERRTKHALLARALGPAELGARLPELLAEGRDRLAGWGPEALRPARS